MTKQSQCMDCAHFIKVVSTEDVLKWYCDAYPEENGDGIPAPIFQNDVSHVQAYDNDNGIRYKPKQEVVR